MRQGNLDKVKGVCRINAVYKVTQCQFTGCMERVSLRYPLVVLDCPLAFFPLSREASTPATAPSTSTNTALLVKLCVDEFAKSHSWQCNYEASAESKTASVIRKQRGNEQAPGRHAECVVPFPLHRARDVAERPPSVPLPMRSDGPPKSKQRLAYRQADICTPYEACVESIHPDVVS